MANDPSYTINEFCELERCSRGWLYAQWKNGRGPRFYYAGSGRRISDESRTEWRRRLEAETEAVAARSTSDMEASA